MNEAKHASAPPGYKCSDCTMDDEPCPRCYTAWWQARHPDTCMVSVGDSELNALRAELARLRSLEEVAEADSLARAIAASEANCDALRAELAAVKADVSELRALDNEAQHGADELTADAKRYRWLKAHHLQTGPDSWIRTGDDLEEAVDAARAQAGDSPPPDNWHEPADGRRLAKHNKDK